MIEIKTPAEVETMRASCKLAARALELVGRTIRAGITTQELNDLVHDFFRGHGAISAPLGYRGSDGSSPPFPRSICTSINDVVCHGIPRSDEIIKDGDIVNVDVTCILDGFHGDTSAMYVIGNASKDAQRVTDVAFRALHAGIEQVKPGGRTGDIGAAIQKLVESEGFSIVRDFVGHGIGRKFHTDPRIFHYGRWGRGTRLQPGMTFTIEPMVNVGSREVITEPDEWTVKTLDGSLSAQWEHTLLVTETGVEVLTKL